MRILIVISLLLLISLQGLCGYSDSLISIYELNKRDSIWHDASWRLGTFYSENGVLDSCTYWSKLTMKEAKEDYQVGRGYEAMGRMYDLANQIDSANMMIDQGLEKLDGSGRYATLGDLWKAKAQIYSQRHTESDTARFFYRQAVHNYELAKDEYRLGIANNMMAYVYYTDQNYERCIEHLKIASDHWDKDSSAKSIQIKATVQYNMSLLLLETGDTLNCIKEAKVCRAMILGDKKRTDLFVAACSMLGGLESDMKNYDVAFDYYLEASKGDTARCFLETQVQLNHGIASMYQAIMNDSVWFDNKEVHELSLDRNEARDSSLVYYAKALFLSGLEHRTYVRANVLAGMATLYNDIGDYKKGQQSVDLCLSLYDSLKNVEATAAPLEIRSEIMAGLGAYKEAYSSLKAHVDIQDSLDYANNMEETARKASGFNYEKKTMVMKQDNLLLAERQKRDRITMIGILVGGGILLVFFLLLWKRFQFTKRQNRIIQQQQNELERTHKQLSDSINYAEVIQSSLLAKSEQVKAVFANSFIVYSSGDAVSNDLYFVRQVGDLKLIIVANGSTDGVQGTFMSFIANSLIKRVVAGAKVENAATVLHAVSKLMNAHLTNNDNHLTDGLSITVCLVDEKQKLVHVSSANSAMVLMSNNNHVNIQTGSSNEQRKGEMIGGKFVYYFRNETEPLRFDSCIVEPVNEAISYSDGDQIFMYSNGAVDAGSEPQRAGIVERLTDVDAMREKEESIRISIQSDQKKYGDADICVIGIEL